MCKLKYARETKLRIKENSKFGRKWDKFQNIKAQKSSQLVLSGRFVDLYGRPGDWCHIQESSMYVSATGDRR